MFTPGEAFQLSVKCTSLKAFFKDKALHTVRILGCISTYNLESDFGKPFQANLIFVGQAKSFN